ncbi:MAG: hypothetical protein RBR43_09865 [Desulfuromonadaceae bacterium]|nr:hypothetical protein [Desulfuromonadaceae bacterium]
MTDRELLALAAKAIGITGEWSDTYQRIEIIDAGKFTAGWNPLKDDGDALRLAVDMAAQQVSHVELFINADPDDKQPFTHIYTPAAGEHIHYGLDRECDMRAVTRRAIVYAAARIGRLQ